MRKGGIFDNFVFVELKGKDRFGFVGVNVKMEKNEGTVEKI